MNPFQAQDRSACGVGFISSRKNVFSHAQLELGLHALRCVEHRGACAADQVTGDGAGIMTDIPFELFGIDRNSMAVATLFLPVSPDRQRKALTIFEEIFRFYGMEVENYRDVPTNPEVLGEEAKESVPVIIQAFIKRPTHCRTDLSYDKLLFTAKQQVRLKTKEAGFGSEFFFVSLSSKTIIYKALTKSNALDQFYPDLRNPRFKTRFVLFHRRFSTNTKTSWDKAQPFRLVAHNGEINTIIGNRSWAIAREKSLGVQRDELLTRDGISDSGSLNEMVESMRYRSGIPHVEDALAIMMPPADQHNEFYKFWSRSMEPWDGPAFVTYSDGNIIGARLDRNGFRPCRWAITDDHFYLSSEAGIFDIDEKLVHSKGTLNAGNGVSVDLKSGELFFRDPSHSRENESYKFDARTTRIQQEHVEEAQELEHKKAVFSYTDEDLKMILYPMVLDGKEPIGSMGDTARVAIFSDQPRSFFDFFYQNFAQVTNPPLDYLREKMVTDLTTYLGKKPNIFETKELIPLAPALELKSPVLSLGQMAYLRKLMQKPEKETGAVPIVFDTTFNKSHGAVGLKNRLKELEKEAIRSAEQGKTVIILSDESASFDKPAIPSLIALRAVVTALNNAGLRLETSIVVHSGEIKSTHHVACLIGYGANAVSPYLALEIARFQDDRKLNALDADTREANLIKSLESGLLKIMSKVGISVVRSYQSAKSFTALGLGKNLMRQYFSGTTSPIGGYELEHIVSQIEKTTAVCEKAELEGSLPIKTYQFKEHNKGIDGERHSMTNTRSKLIHELVRETGFSLKSMELYDTYLRMGLDDEPVNIRHLFDLKRAEKAISVDKVEPIEEITKTFGSGAMSFGAISAESQRDIIEAMKEIGGRSNSGEGGENPFYYTNGISASIKQVASARFGVTAEYLVAGDEVQIKVAQGAKPGEGGQLMGLKVDADIAKARHANVGVDLISPPPLHDIYSIEDLKQLIYELKQLKPGMKVGVKLVAGAHIGTIAVGVAKAGADIIHVSGGDGGTGAASLSSMKHAGLPWELGLFEVHQTLINNNLRKNVILRTDGGLSTGKDIVMAALLGAEEFDFGKLLLVAEGCVMARICEKNTCPTGIATHDPKFKAKYKGTKDDVVNLCKYIAEDVRRNLAMMGFTTLDEIIGRNDLLTVNEKRVDLIRSRNLDLGYFFDTPVPSGYQKTDLFNDGISPLNQQLVHTLKPYIQRNEAYEGSFDVYSTDRAVLSTLSGYLAKRRSERRLAEIKGEQAETTAYTKKINLNFTGSGGQGFGVFMVEGLDVKLYGEANDSVAKGMSGGKLVITPNSDSKYDPSNSAIIGNCALYGATGGTLYVHGLAGDRFAVRNSGATAVVEGLGLHACEYMTNGRVVVLGRMYHNLGAGMTGGELFTYGDPGSYINKEYIAECSISEEYYQQLYVLLDDYHRETGSSKAKYILKDWEEARKEFHLFVPLGLLRSKYAETEPVKS
ncbi:glutamate synthase large subunit [bacterium]|nr:MAG: glutamate synthase large subunit [bacterium]